MKIITGLSAGIFWALDTVILGIALSMLPFISLGQAAVLAPFVSTFLHDFCSGVWLLIYMGIKKQYQKIWQAIYSKSGKYIILGALFGGPLGMTGYVFSIRYLGASYTAMISAVFPALGALLSYFFLGERMKRVQLTGLGISILGMAILGISVKGESPENFAIGIFCALLCVAGWSAEVVICAYGMKKSGISHEQALTIRQLTSSFFHGIVILNLVKGWELTAYAASKPVLLVIAAAALAGTTSYLCYYKTIGRLGASKAMALNITYSAWAIIFEFVFFHKIPGAVNLLCAGFVLSGSLLAAADPKQDEEVKNGLYRD